VTRVLLIVRNPGFLRYIETQIRTLCEQGDRVHIGIQEAPFNDADGLLGILTQTYPDLVVSHAPPRIDAWKQFSGDVRSALDYCRYLHPDYANAGLLRQRAEVKISPLGYAVERFIRSVGLHKSAWGVSSVLNGLRMAHDAIPPDAGILEYIRSDAPDVVIVTSLVWPRSHQPEYVLAARSLRIQTAYIVNSWDNLSNKGDIKTIPDTIYVWNEQQRAEASRLHGAAPEQVVVTGAPLFDRWFGKAPTETRKAFCARVGLPDDRPYILYVCSSPRIAADDSEPAFVRSWLKKLRGKRTAASKVNVLVRPHPHNAKPWRSVDLEDAGTAIHPKDARWVVQEQQRDDYFNALFYCSAVMGINTSAMLEAAIVGAPTVTLENGSFQETQGGTLHFHYLTQLGIVTSTDTIKTNIAALAEAVETAVEGRPPLPGVVTFVRPHGVERQATPIAVEALLSQAAKPAKPRGAGVAALAGRGLRRLLVAVNDSKVRKTGEAGSEGRRLTIWDGLRRRYADRWFPNIVEFAVRLLPPDNFVLRQEVKATLGGTEFTRFQWVEQAMREARQGDAPILVGPWISEVGFEALYWIPFVRWYRKHYRIPQARFVVISRGGVKSWYGGISDKYFDVFDLLTPEQFRNANLDRTAQQRGRQKQYSVSEMEQSIYDAVAKKIGAKEYNILHPAMMYRLFYRFWKEVGGIGFAKRYTVFQQINFAEERVRELLPKLPREYVAVKFYARESLPDTPETRAFIAKVISTISARIPVVLIRSDLSVDDHSDFKVHTNDQVTVIDPMTSPSCNLEIQTAIIAGSKLFVGTYGGTTYPANLLGKTAICFEREGKHNHPAHTEFAQRVLKQFGSLYVLNTQDFEAFELIFSSALKDERTGPAGDSGQYNKQVTI